MTKNIALIERQGATLFNFWLKKQPKDKRIGDLTVGDFIEMCKVLAKIGSEDATNQR
jgi:hypothetical protein